MSKVLCLCDQGNNRSVMVAHQIKYLGHDTIPAGLKTNSPATLSMLYDWADRIITTDETQRVPTEHAAKVQLWNIGPDTYPRPFNKQLLPIVKQLVAENRAKL